VRTAEGDKAVSQRPVIGITMQTQESSGNDSSVSWSLGARYVQPLAAAGAVPFLIPLLPEDEATLRAVFAHLDGLFLTGGCDIDPALYGEERHPRCERSDPAREETERVLLRWALATCKPVFGICRGMQMINVASGGSLYQDLAAQQPTALRHDYFSCDGFARDRLTHDVRIEPGSRLAQTLAAEQMAVNSMHHQGVKRLAPGLRATAFAPDGLVEGIEGTGPAFLVGVQWHPEELVEADAAMQRLFIGFVEAAQAYRSS
jgi:putative glutamine amidotransferase